mmetsp:Transcript_5543/g.5979  ORF Transcript_5543/g.5979 Transcript_5543/m.5979 type:complete len:168 (-) Transcript_5543:104-607(-)
MGGKKKASKPPLKKESKYKIPAMYKCPLCDAKSSIIIKITRKTSEAKVHCRACGASKTGIRCNRLEINCDVYFKFRELVQEHDRAYLREEGVQVQAANIGMEGLQLLEEYNNNHHSHSAAASLLYAGSNSRSRRNEQAADTEDDPSHFFAPSAHDDGDEASMTLLMA